MQRHATPTRRQRLMDISRKRTVQRGAARRSPNANLPTAYVDPVTHQEDPPVRLGSDGEPEPFIGDDLSKEDSVPEDEKELEKTHESATTTMLKLTETNLSLLASDESSPGEKDLPPPPLPHSATHITPRVSNQKSPLKDGSTTGGVEEKKSDWSFSSSIQEAYRRIQSSYGTHCDDAGVGLGLCVDEANKANTSVPDAAETSGESYESDKRGFDVEELKNEIQQTAAMEMTEPHSLPAVPSVDSMGKPPPMQMNHKTILDPAIPKPIAVQATSPDRMSSGVHFTAPIANGTFVDDIDHRAETPVVRIQQPPKGQFHERAMHGIDPISQKPKSGTRKKKSGKIRHRTKKRTPKGVCTPIDIFGGCGRLQDALLDAMDNPDPNNSMMVDDDEEESSTSEGDYGSEEESHSDTEGSYTDSATATTHSITDRRTALPKRPNATRNNLSRENTSKAVRPSSRLDLHLPHSRQPHPTPNLDRGESFDNSVWDTKLNADSPAFVKAYISGLQRKGLPLLLHRKRRIEVMNQATKVRMFVRLGKENSLGNYSMPKLEWIDENGKVVGSVGLFDIRTLEKASAIQLERYPLAMPGRSLFVKMNHSSDIVLEARSEDSALHFIHGMRWVIARLSFNLIIGNLGSSCELLDVKMDSGDILDDDRSFPATPTEEKRWNRAMNDVANQMIDTTLTTMAVV